MGEPDGRQHGGCPDARRGRGGLEGLVTSAAAVLRLMMMMLGLLRPLSGIRSVRALFFSLPTRVIENSIRSKMCVCGFCRDAVVLRSKPAPEGSAGRPPRLCLDGWRNA